MDRKILLIEDEEELAKDVAKSIQDAEFICRVTHSVPDALVKIRNEKFDVILLDLKLKQGSGVTLAETIRANKGGFNYATPILVTSAHVDADALENLKSLVNGFMVKPYNSDALIDKIKQLLPKT